MEKILSVYTVYQPLQDRVLIEPIKETDQKTDGGLYIPDTVRKDVVEGIVYAVGPGYHAKETGVFVATMLHEGERVLVGRDYGTPITVDKKELRLMREDDVLMVIKEKE